MPRALCPTPTWAQAADKDRLCLPPACRISAPSRSGPVPPAAGGPRRRAWRRRDASGSSTRVRRDPAGHGYGSLCASRASAGAAPGGSSIRSAPVPVAPRQITPRAGAAITPATGTPSSTSAILTAYSSRPASNSRVPSSGSTRRKRLPRLLVGRWPVASSEITGRPGRKRAKPSRITRSAASSAAVTGERSAFSRTPRPASGPPGWQPRPARRSW